MHLLKTIVSHRWFHPLLLLIWIAVGASLRLLNLTGKPPWTDEFATLVFSLGNSFKTVPLDQAISLETLLAPLHPNPANGASAVIHHLITEDHHPPLYFVLVHWWMQLFPADAGYVSLWAARSLPALFGVAAIPATYALGFLAFRSRLVAQLAAAIIAVCPFGIFLTQEARHYALGMLWVIASLCCLVIALQHLNHQKPIPIWIVLSWVIVNSLGIATHYFFSLTLCAEAIALIGFGILKGNLTSILKIKSGKWRKSRPLPHAPLSPQETPTPHPSWWRLAIVAAGTLSGCLVWIPIFLTGYEPQMTQWIKSTHPTILTLISPVFQALAAWITMLCLLPVESPSLPIAIASGAVMLVFLIYAIPLLYQGFTALLRQAESRLETGILGGFGLGAIALFFAITYLLGIDLTRGARYNFVYFPVFPVLLAAVLAIIWKGSTFADATLQTNCQTSTINPKSSGLNTKGKQAVTIIWLMGLLSGITVASNLGYQKYYRPDLLVPVIQQASSVPVVIATTHNTLVQTGEIMGLAWEFKRTKPKLANSPQFLLAHQSQDHCEETACPASITLQQTLAKLPRPMDLWLVNFKAPIQPEPPNCFAEDTSQYQTSVNGYASRLYHCLAADAEARR